MHGSWFHIRRQVGRIGISFFLAALASAPVAAAARLSVWAPGVGASTPDSEIWAYVAGEFEKRHPGVKVDVRILPENLEEQYVVAFAAGTAPDVGYMWNEMMPGFISKNILRPVDRFITKQDEANYYDINYTRFMGQRWGLPLFAGSRIFFYNRAALAQNGLLPPDTWDEFRTAAKKLTLDRDGDGTPDRWGFRLSWQGSAYGGLNDSWDPWFLQAGGAWFSDDMRRTSLNTEAGRETLSFLHGLIYEDRSTWLGGGSNSFLDGTVAMIYTGEYMSGRARQSAPDLDFGVKIGLMNKNRKSWFAADYWAMFSSTKEPQLAWDWMKFTTSGPIMRHLHRYIVQLPIARDEGNPFPADPAFREFIPNMGLMQARPIVPNGSKVYQAVWDTLRKAMHNEIPVSQALEEADRQGARLLQEGWSGFSP